MAAAALDGLPPAHEEPRLRAPQELVAAEADEVRPRRDRAPQQRLAGKALAARSTAHPEPRSCATGIPCSRPRAASSSISTSAVKPSMR